jgi:uncharacterized membrane protein (DUF485 family)
MSGYSGWLLKLDERIPLLYRLMTFFYFTNMAIPIFLVYFVLLIIASYEIPSIYVSYLIIGIGTVIGITLGVLMIMSMCRDVKEVKELRNLYDMFYEKFKKDYGKYSDETRETFINFQNIFLRIFPRNKIDEMKKNRLQ